MVTNFRKQYEILFGCAIVAEEHVISRLAWGGFESHNSQRCLHGQNFDKSKELYEQLPAHLRSGD